MTLFNIYKQDDLNHNQLFLKGHQGCLPKCKTISLPERVQFNDHFYVQFLLDVPVQVVCCQHYRHPVHSSLNSYKKRFIHRLQEFSVDQNKKALFCE